MAAITTLVDLVGLRVGITLSAWTSGPVTVHRVHANGDRVAVRDVPDASGGTTFAYDFETHLVEAFTYESYSGATLITSGAVTVATTDMYVSVPGMPSMLLRIDAEEVPDAVMERQTAELSGPFRSIAPSEYGELQSPTFTLTLKADSLAKRSMVERMLVSGVLFVRMPLTEYSATYVEVSRVARSTYVPWRRQDATTDSVPDWRHYALACRTTASPVGASFGDPTASYQALVNSGKTYQHLLDWKGVGVTTYLQMLQGRVLMQPVSSDWDGALRTARKKASRVEVWAPGASSAVVLTAKAGTVRVDESSAVRRALSLSLADLYLPDTVTPLTPRNVSDLLAPFGTEIRVWSGHQYTSGWTELVPVGVFTLTDIDRPSWLSMLSLTAPDRSRSVSLARFLKPYNVAAGTLVTAVITALIQRGGAFPVVDLSGSRTLTTAASYEAGADPWEKARELATSIGCEVAPDATGAFVIRPVPQVATPVWTVNIDKTRGTLLDIGQKMTAEGVYNALAVSSSAAGTDPITGYAWVSDGDLAVTRVGWRSTFFSTPIGITTTDQAMAAAAAMLPSKMAAARILEPVTVANVALDVGDTVSLSVPISKDRLAVETIPAVVSSLSFSLEPNAGGMRLGVRYPAPVTTGTVVTGS